ncbi:MAG: histidine--tRNA ligase [Sorangiineae bacterium]|nr:histidine--tRNA ligase [Polyangiaceae bacterium]MEB2323169.1 histidine--tRNA ligase [Sorangiineae bacterium]
MQFRRVKGMNDILPDEVGRWHRLEDGFRRTAELHGYSEIRTPVLEPTELFVRSLGDTTDVVEKEMFTFSRHDESLTLRPEGTAGVARAYVEAKVQSREPVSRFYYLGPMFRAERPQRGRYRQFHQAGCEIFGDPGPSCDAELIDMLCGLFGELGIGELEVCVGSLGGPASRARYRAALLEYLRPRAGALSEHARARLEVNPLRILDSKDPRDQEAARGAPAAIDSLDDADRAHWEALLRALDALGTPYRVEAALVRGLDYYTRTLFEIRTTAGSLGAQNTIAGGGRYDAMIAELGGPPVPAIGFAMGLERLLLAMPEAPARAPALAYLAPIGEPAIREALRLARELRRLGVRAELDGRGNSMKSMLRRADAMGARLALVLGDDELGREVVKVKDLVERTEDDLPRASVAEAVRARLAPQREGAA